MYLFKEYMKENDKQDKLLSSEEGNKDNNSSDEDEDKNNIIKTDSENKKDNLELLQDKIEKPKEEEDDLIPEIEPKRNFTPFKDDPFLDSNFISRFFMYWAFKVLNISKKKSRKKERKRKKNSC